MKPTISPDEKPILRGAQLLAVTTVVRWGIIERDHVAKILQHEYNLTRSRALHTIYRARRAGLIRGLNDLTITPKGQAELHQYAQLTNAIRIFNTDSSNTDEQEGALQLYGLADYY